MTIVLESGSASLADRGLRRAGPPPSTANRGLLSQEATRQIPLPMLAGEIQIEVVGPETNWLYPALDAVLHLGQLDSNWDSYGGRHIQPFAAIGALKFLDLLFPGDGPTPAFVPMSCGGVQLEWHRADLDLEVEFAASGRASALLADLTTGRQFEFDSLTPEAITSMRAALFR